MNFALIVAFCVIAFILGAAFLYLALRVSIALKNKENKVEPRAAPEKKKKAEFTKAVIGGVMFLYFAAAVFGGVIVWLMPDMLGEWLTFIGAPTTAALGFYCWKAKNENIIKLGGKPDYETAENDDEEAKG